MQCKDIPDEPILRLLVQSHGGLTWFAGFPRSVQQAMPSGVPEKLARAKMAMLIRRGLVDGCSCGCRGDYEITEAGRAALPEAPRDDGAVDG